MRTPVVAASQSPTPVAPHLHVAGKGLPSVHLSFDNWTLKWEKKYTSIDPKQQQTMFPRRSCAIKTSLGAPFLRQETKEKKGDKPRNPSPEPERARKSRWNTILFLRKERKEKQGNKPRNPSWNKKEGGNHDGTQCHNTRETSPTTLPGTRWNQDMMMEQNARRLGNNPRNPTRNQNARRLGRQSPEPYPKPKDLGNDDGTECQNTRNQKIMAEQNCFLKKLGTPFSSRAVWATSPRTLAGTGNG